ncbi:MAG: hypothetical protein KDK39_15720 [Leptospiraceae bacterium]|nr:hypothetical protein [Leptospiraceae bacterium]
MATNAAMIRKNRLAFNVHAGSKESRHIHQLDFHHNAADSYYAQLCASCHLNMEKDRPGAFRGYDKGGGCLACHLGNDEPEKHLNIGQLVSDKRCFNCHSRSGRISLSYRGWAELSDPKDSPATTLADNRTVYQKTADLHYTAGLMCNDCHVSTELMGDGKSHHTKRDSLQINCADCHSKPAPNGLLAIESNQSAKTTTQRFLILKRNQKKLAIPPYQNAHAGHNPEHARLTCSACHSTWAPDCFGCHIEYDQNAFAFNHITGQKERGQWQEYHGESRTELPVLGVDNRGRIDSFIPGMKLSIDKSGFSRPKEDLIEKNIFVPLSPHTIGKSRSCQSCHLNAHALGYGLANLKYQNGTWLVINEYQTELQGKYKGLPQDAWILPGQTNTESPDGRSLNAQEQTRMLDIGRCIQAHQDTNAAGQLAACSQRHRN